MAQTKPYVRIHSNKTINVTAGLHNQDVTNKDAHIPDRLKVNPTWPKLTCLIKQGPGIYPSEIIEWPTVKALAKDKVLTIGEYVDSPESEEMESKKTSLVNELKKVNNQKQSLADIAE